MKYFWFTILLVTLFSSACSEAEIQTMQPTYIPFPTYTEYPTYTPLPTDTPANTPSPSPTINATKTALMSTVIAFMLNPVTPQPSATLWTDRVTCSEILSKYNNSTDLQWHDFIAKVLGRNFHFSGEIFEVIQGNLVMLSLDGDDIYCDVWLYNISNDIALRLYKDQRLEGYGTIRDIDEGIFSGYVVVDINVIPDTLIIH
jgi:hypothetical protein